MKESYEEHGYRIPWDEFVRKLGIDADVNGIIDSNGTVIKGCPDTVRVSGFSGEHPWYVTVTVRTRK